MVALDGRHGDAKTNKPHNLDDWVYSKLLSSGGGGVRNRLLCNTDNLESYPKFDFFKLIMHHKTYNNNRYLYIIQKIRFSSVG